ncbi:UDP-N-acetylglucosamine 1-carboxyvinyltransferase [Rossellomorea aquimaris]|nr:UDP-N-acetylglucosamine 1-carboxyvinyltransferase [Rossellomorea aquimaris]
MNKMLIKGGNKLNGKVRISGAKNSAVAILPATILSDTPVKINGLPNISDVHILTDLLNDVGGEATLNNNTLTLNPDGMNFNPVKKDKAQKLRASYYFMGAMLGKYKKAQIGLPGGCHLGPRPIDLHIKGFEALGAKVSETNDGDMYLHAEELRGADIYLDFASVGATINIMLAASKAKGKTVITNAAQEPEIVDVANFLMSMGADIKGAGTNTISIQGVEELKGEEHTIIPDRMEAGTYTILAAAIGEKIVIENIIPEHLEPLFAKLKEMGANLFVEEDRVTVTRTNGLKSVDVTTQVHPGFPTDLQQPFTTLLNVAEGKGTVTDTIYNERFKQIHEISKMGGDGKVKGNTVTIAGKNHLHGAKVKASDLRAGAALVIAGLIAEGVTEITGVEHIERGYSEIVEKLTTLGATIWYETQEEYRFSKPQFRKPILSNLSLVNS